MSVSKIVREIWEQPDNARTDKLKPVKKLESAHKKKKIRVLKPSDIINKQRSIYEFTGAFFESFGNPERHARWFITGPSFSGKSSFVFTLCDYLTQHGIVDYNNHEEAGGDAQTVADKLQKHVAEENRSKIRLYKAPIESDTHETFLERLMKKGSADFAVLDSVQHAEMNRSQYLHITGKLSNPAKAKA
ncbi:hypothetical protein LWM68_40785 [Niabella sp. W65]|nr:hypothetical protein [Niabella sp. W65]MCH7368510.1 hypothetical protein [Niabella sp. W65]ULT44100.1 hypothetical protein KRR40_12485 [Niabella sp. I65]